MDDIDFFKRVNRFFNREKGVIQNLLALEPTEVPHADPQQEQREALRSAIHTLILEQVREHCEKGKGRLSIHFSKMAKRDSSATENIVLRSGNICGDGY
ncbi:hypothetical protein CRYUN_Cryun19dG0043600 [Craigia yunnanensis]